MLAQIKNFWTLYKWHKDVSKIKNKSNFLNRYRHFTPKRKGCSTRNLIASILKQIRDYKVIDYSQAKEIYDEYWILENHIPSFEYLREKVKEGEVWVTLFRNEYPVKGSRFCEYFINSSGGLKTFKLSSEEKSYGFVSDPFVNEFGNSISEENLTQFKFATKEEIQKEKSRQKKISDIEKLIKIKQKELSVLHSQKNEI